MLTNAINKLGGWISGVPWVPFSVAPGPTWILSAPTSQTATQLHFSVADRRFPKLSGELWLEHGGKGRLVTFQVTQSKGVVSGIERFELERDELRAGKWTLGQLRCTQAERNIVDAWLAEAS